MMLKDNGISDVSVISVGGELTDHYSPMKKTVNLSHEVYNGRNAAAAAIAFFREEKDYNPIIEKQIYKYIKEQGFEYDINENYGDPIQYGKYIVKRDIYDLEGDIIINSGEVIDFKEDTQSIMGYDVFKYNNVFLTTEDLNG